MNKKTILTLTILSQILLTETGFLCIYHVAPECIFCQKRTFHDKLCIERASDVKVLTILGKTSVNYDRYINSSIKLINERNLKTFYSCFDYFQVYTYTFYPVRLNLLFLQEPQGIVPSRLQGTFQRCLDKFCSATIRTNNYNYNRFLCYENRLKSLDFLFNYMVTLSCVQNITYAFISSQWIEMLDVNYFFSNAYNLVYLKLELLNLKKIESRVFGNLRYLKFVKFIYKRLPLEDYERIFEYTHSLVKIDVANVSLWIKCKLQKNNTLVVKKSLVRLDGVIISGLLLLCTFCILVKVFIKYCRRYFINNSLGDSNDVVCYDNKTDTCRIYS